MPCAPPHQQRLVAQRRKERAAKTEALDRKLRGLTEDAADAEDAEAAEEARQLKEKEDERERLFHEEARTIRPCDKHPTHPIPLTVVRSNPSTRPTASNACWTRRS